MRRLFHASWIALFALTLAALAAFYWVGFTESGLHRLAAFTSRRIGPVTMRIEGARGTLSYGAYVERFVLDHRRVHIEADHINLNVAMIGLFALNIHVPHATADRLLIQVLPAGDDKSAWTPHFLRGPLTIEAPSVQVKAGTLIATNGRRFDVVLRLDDANRTPEALSLLRLDTPTGAVPVSSFATISQTSGPSQISERRGTDSLTLNNPMSEYAISTRPSPIAAGFAFAPVRIPAPSQPPANMATSMPPSRRINPAR